MGKVNNIKWDICIYVNFGKICNDAHIIRAHGNSNIQVLRTTQCDGRIKSTL